MTRHLQRLLESRSPDQPRVLVRQVATASIGALLGTIVGAVVAPTKVHRWIPVRPHGVTRAEPGP